MPRKRNNQNNDDYAPLLQQRRFPHRRHLSKPRSSLPPKTKKQNSLTQMDWVVRPDNEMEIIDNSESEVEEVEDVKPRKRRSAGKFDSKPESQGTYTQFVRTGSVMSGRRKRKMEVDDDGFGIWREDAEVGLKPMDAVKRRRLARDVDALEVTNWTKEDVDSGYESRLVSATEIANSSSQVGLDDASSMIGAQPSIATTARTPKRRLRFTDAIPSSQSPASIKLSTQRSQRFRDADKRSPLKETSGNVQQSPVKRHHGEGTQRAGWRLLDSVFIESQKDDHGDAEDVVRFDQEDEDDVPEVAAVEIKVEPLQATSTLQRNTTVEDSQDPSVEIKLEPPTQSTKRLLKRITTVQDSDTEDLDSQPADDLNEHETDALTEHEDDDDEDHDEDYEDDDPEQNTFDPAYSALDRDAARFANMTQAHGTQGYVLEPHVSNSTACSDDEEGLPERNGVGGQPMEINHDETVEDDEAIKGQPAFAADQSDGVESEIGDEEADPAAHQLSTELTQAAIDAERVPSSQSPERSLRRSSRPLHHSSSVAMPSDPAPQITAAGEIKFLLAKAHPQDLLADEDEEERIPSSPPPLRPSQISTVVPSQFSAPARPSYSSRSHRIKHEVVETQLTFTSPTRSPQHQHSDWPPLQAKTVERESSPFPLPPWSSPGMHLRHTEGSLPGSGVGLGDFVDFSLPPPPPMLSSSSRMGTQRGEGMESDEEL